MGSDPRDAETDRDRGDAVNLATSLRLHEINRPAPELPSLPWTIETNIGKFQAGYFPKEPTADICCME